MEQCNDELMHYGVLGMKWGQRKVRKNTAKAAGARAIGKTAKANKYSAKAARIENKHVGRAGGKKAYNYTKNQSTGKAFVKSMLMGTYGTTKYNKARSLGDSRLKSGAKGLGTHALDLMTLGTMGIVEPRVSGTIYKKRNK